MTELDRDQLRIKEYLEWKNRTIFMSVDEYLQRVNNPADGLLLNRDQTFICILSCPEDILKVANKMESVTALETAGLLKQIWFIDETGQEEYNYLVAEDLIKDKHEVYVHAADVNFVSQSFLVVQDINRYYAPHEQVHIIEKTEERLDYTLVPQAIGESLKHESYPCLLLVSDHKEFDRAGDMEVRHTMVFSLPPGVQYVSNGSIHYELR